MVFSIESHRSTGANQTPYRGLEYLRFRKSRECASSPAFVADQRMRVFCRGRMPQVRHRELDLRRIESQPAPEIPEKCCANHGYRVPSEKGFREAGHEFHRTSLRREQFVPGTLTAHGPKSFRLKVRESLTYI